ncbi:MAG: hypothetical protein O2856_09825, partial [Planctomycetota bacterium]|nr:hypothetical protein [Planctomycetota bacterium]
MLRIPSLMAVALVLASPLPVYSDDKPAHQKTVEEASKVDNPDVKLTAGTWKDVQTLVENTAGKIVVIDI